MRKMSAQATPVESSQREEISAKVVEAVAAAKGIEPTALDTRLYEIIDPDALDAIFRPKADGTPRIGGKITFTMDGCRVAIHNDGNVDVTPPAEETAPRYPLSATSD